MRMSARLCSPPTLLSSHSPCSDNELIHDSVVSMYRALSRPLRPLRPIAVLVSTHAPTRRYSPESVPINFRSRFSLTSHVAEYISASTEKRRWPDELTTDDCSHRCWLACYPTPNLVGTPEHAWTTPPSQPNRQRWTFLQLARTHTHIAILLTQQQTTNALSEDGEDGGRAHRWPDARRKAEMHLSGMAARRSSGQLQG